MQVMYVLRNIEARVFSHCCCGKAMRITYSVCVSVALVTRHAMYMCRIVVCGLSGPTIFFPHYLINRKIFERQF
jgi:hypothetical protein